MGLAGGHFIPWVQKYWQVPAGNLPQDLWNKGPWVGRVLLLKGVPWLPNRSLSRISPRACSTHIVGLP